MVYCFVMILYELNELQNLSLLTEHFNQVTAVVVVHVV